jgi:hypothetical protein
MAFVPDHEIHGALPEKTARRPLARAKSKPSTKPVARRKCARAKS